MSRGLAKRLACLILDVDPLEPLIKEKILEGVPSHGDHSKRHQGGFSFSWSFSSVLKTFENILPYKPRTELPIGRSFVVRYYMINFSDGTSDHF